MGLSTTAIIINLKLVDAIIGEDGSDVNEHEYFLELVADRMRKEKALALVNPLH